MGWTKYARVEVCIGKKSENYDNVGPARKARWKGIGMMSMIYEDIKSPCTRLKSHRSKGKTLRLILSANVEQTGDSVYHICSTIDTLVLTDTIVLSDISAGLYVSN